MILAWTGDELSHGQARDYHTHRRMDGQTQTDTQTDRPKQQQYPKAKTGLG